MYVDADLRRANRAAHNDAQYRVSNPVLADPVWQGTAALGAWSWSARAGWREGGLRVPSHTSMKVRLSPFWMAEAARDLSGPAETQLMRNP